MPFGLGRPVRSTLTLLILVPHAPLPPLYSPARLHLLNPPLPALKDRGHAEGGRIRVGYDPLQVDSRPAREHLANNHGAENYGAGSYGKRCPEGMLGAASALPGTRAFTA